MFVGAVGSWYWQGNDLKTTNYRNQQVPAHKRYMLRKQQTIPISFKTDV